jgi:hypothetical protein
MAIVITSKHVQESLVNLYLRLNGYFTSGHIVHATPDNLAARERTEIDVFALRLPYSREPETGNSPSEYLDVKNGILDVIIGEVKSGKRPIQFNPGIRDTENMASVLRRAGFTNNDKALYKIARTLTEQMIPQPVNQPDARIEITLDPSEDIRYPTRIRPILFHLGYKRPNKTQAWFVGYQEIMNFTWQCLRKEFQPDSCQREYDYGLWGPVVESIVDYFKNESRTEPGTPKELVNTLVG